MNNDYKITVKKNAAFFSLKTCNIFIHGPLWRTSKLQEKPPALKRKHRARRNYTFFHFYSFLVDNFYQPGSGFSRQKSMRIRIHNAGHKWKKCYGYFVPIWQGGCLCSFIVPILPASVTASIGIEGTTLILLIQFSRISTVSSLSFLSFLLPNFTVCILVSILSVSFLSYVFASSSPLSLPPSFVHFSFHSIFTSFSPFVLLRINFHQQKISLMKLPPSTASI